MFWAVHLKAFQSQKYSFISLTCLNKELNWETEFFHNSQNFIPQFEFNKKQLKKTLNKLEKDGAMDHMSSQSLPFARAFMIFFFFPFLPQSSLSDCV